MIEGIAATDIFTLNSALGATIETQVVTTLNGMREVWDPDKSYRLYGFVRQPQTFPDIVFRRFADKNLAEAECPPVFGLELKGWYLLSKEGEPSGRYKVTPAACAQADLLVVVPWVLTNVISGKPIVFRPFVESAHYAAERRNYHWQHTRKAQGSSEISSPADVAPYPRKADKISDVPVSDKGGNFGRFARSGFMDEFFVTALQEPISGIRAEHWLKFFKVFQEQRGGTEITTEIEKLRGRLTSSGTENTPKVTAALEVIAALERMLD